jgi:hypothetical protein
METLTIADVIALGTVVDAASQSAKVAWVDPDTGDIRYGTARHIVVSPDNYGFLPRDTDVRDGYLRVTTRSGFDVALSVRALITLVQAGEFSIYDW